MSNKRANIKKIFKCSICAKADYRSVVPGAITFFNRCTLTPGCVGVLSVDPNADVTARSHITWRQTPKVYKTSFTSVRTIVLTHNFGHIGSLIVEIFVEANTSGGISRVKTTAFTVVSQTADTVIIDLLTPQTGVAVVTDNQFNPPTLVVPSTSWTAPSLLTSNILTIAADIEASSFTATLSYKSLTSLDTLYTQLDFINHFQSTGWTTSNVPIGGTLWTHYKVIALEKPYFLYSAVIPTYLLQKGNSLLLTGSTLPTVVLPLATSDKSAAADVVQDRIIRNSTIRLGDLVVDNNQLVVANSTIVEELRKPFVIY
jgi:hypothetical protein